MNTDKIKQAAAALDEAARAVYRLVDEPTTTMPTDEPDADGWIPWHGGEIPVDLDTRVDTKYRRDSEFPDTNMLAGSLYWDHRAFGGDIIAYRLHKPEPPVQDFPPPGFACEVWKDDYAKRVLRLAVGGGFFGSYRESTDDVTTFPWPNWQPANFPGWDVISKNVEGLVYFTDGYVSTTSDPDAFIDRPDVIYIYRRPDGRA